MKMKSVKNLLLLQIIGGAALLLVSCTSSEPLEIGEDGTVTGRQAETKPILETGLGTELAKFNGFYTSIEMEGGRLSPQNLNQEITQYGGATADSITIEYLTKIDNGYLLIFNVHHALRTRLFLSTLNKQYELVDYTSFPNGNRKNDFDKDTIAMPWYNANKVIVEMLRPDAEEVPDFESDGIYKEELSFSKDLKIQRNRL